MTKAHQQYEQALHDRDNLPVIAYGSAGTGKTYGAVGRAVEWLEEPRKKCVITRPNVSFADKNGFLPGTEREKMEPWIRPIEQNFQSHGVSLGQLSSWEGGRYPKLFYYPLEHIQGLTFDDSLVIVDECQNMSFEQLRVFLTRTGKYSKVVLCGDVAQTSPKFHNSGLAELIRMVETLDVPCHTIHFTLDDCMRSDQCKTWLRSFETWEGMTHE